METTIVIPARIGSTRFPAKPLAVIRGKTLIERSWRIASAVQGADAVMIATDSAQIVQEAKRFGANVLLMTEPCQNGTERCFAAMKHTATAQDLIINLQGDAVLTPPWVIEALIEFMHTEKQIQVATPCVLLQGEALEDFAFRKEQKSSSGTSVVFDQKGYALYFSKAMLPFCRTASSFYRHIGVYAYRFHALSRWAHLPPTPLEQSEQLEQLRALENQIPIKIIKVDYRDRTHHSVDLPEDLALVEAVIEKEGELV